MKGFFQKLFGTNVDLTTLVSTLILTFFGLILIYSATRNMDGTARYMLVQGGSVLIGLVAMALLQKVDYDRFADLWKLFLGLGLFLLILVLFVGSGENIGSKSWIRLGPVGIQPGELVKIPYIIVLAHIIDTFKQDINKLYAVSLLLLTFGVFTGLILLQPDAGTAMVYTFIFLGMLFLAGIDWRYLLCGFVAFLAATPLLWFFVLDTYQKNRILSFLSPNSGLTDAGYHVSQSKLLIGSGRFFGKGLFQGVQTQMGTLPEKQTDFIFAVLGEECGLIGCLGVMVLYAILIMRSLDTAKRSKDLFGSMLCIGVAMMFTFHVVENIGMCLGVLPVTGIPLPFLSYGGSSVITSLLGIGLVLNVRSRTKPLEFI